MSETAPLPVYLDADVLFAGVSSAKGASYALLLLSELGIIAAYTAQQTVREAERNLLNKVPAAVPELHRAIAHAVHRVPEPSAEVVVSCLAEADPKDAPHLAAARAAGCRWLVTFNVRDYRPTDERPAITLPGPLLVQIRAHVALLRP
jgi:predicted nucleic acid-binding protein